MLKIVIIMLILALMVYCIIYLYSWDRKIQWLEDHGYHRFIYTHDYGGAPVYAWRKTYLDVIGEYFIKDISYKELTEIIK